jgi:succinate dehydrogenase/fumarate reductase flavoprotein subunit
MHMYVGSGAKFVNARGERFMEKYDPVLKERVLLGRLAFGFAMEVRQGKAPIYIDMTHFTPKQVQRLKRVIPLPMMMYEKVGLVKNDKFVEKIEWVSYPPRSIGGCLANVRFETCLPGLYACGDTVPWAGAEGGAAALPGAATSGTTAGISAAGFAKVAGKIEVDAEQVQHLREQAFAPMLRKDGVEPDHVLLAVQETITPYNVLLIREERRMKKALAEIEDTRENLVPLLHAYDPHYLRMALEARNLVTFAEMQLKSALFRKESRGGTCLREDYPYQDNENWLKWVNVGQENGKMKVSTQDIPIDRYPVKPPRDRALDPLWQRAKDLGIVTIKEERVAWE